MSVDNTIPINVYNTNGVTTGFAFNFKILEASDLAMMFDQGALPAFSISGIGDDDGGEVLFVTPPVIGELVLLRQLALVRSTDYQYQGQIPSQVLNADLDRVVMMVQQVNRDLGRSIKVPITDTTDQTLSAGPDERQNTVIGFDASGNLTLSVTDAANVIAAQAAAAAAQAAAASVDPANTVHINGAETIIGLKTFSASPLIPQPAASDESPKAASTAFVRGKDFGLAFSITGNALTIALKRPDGTTDPSAAVPVYLDFRSATAANGGLIRRVVTAASSYTIASGALFGATNGVPFKGWLAAFDTGTGVVIAPINCLSGKDIYPLAQFGLASTVNTAASGAQIFYASAALVNMPYVVLGYFSYETGLATAGTWNALPTRLQVFGNGVPLPGAVVGVARLATGALATGSATIPTGDTIPQNTQGTLFMTKSYQATSAAHVLDIEAKAELSPASAAVLVYCALFQGSQANAFAASAQYSAGASSPQFSFVLDDRVLALSTTATAFSLRAGPESTSVVSFNGRAGVRLLGGALNSFINITERAT